MINSSISQAIAEGLTLGVRAGVNVEALWECVRRGMVGRMHVLHAQVSQNVFRDHYETDTFPSSYCAKTSASPRRWDAILTSPYRWRTSPNRN
jgi:3-hydroxyisobutyrate dehydrogenase-like beta-hydroxyacid dehydrogenase